MWEAPGLAEPQSWLCPGRPVRILFVTVHWGGLLFRSEPLFFIHHYTHQTWHIEAWSINICQKTDLKKNNNNRLTLDLSTWAKKQQFCLLASVPGLQPLGPNSEIQKVLKAEVFLGQLAAKPGWPELMWGHEALYSFYLSPWKWLAIPEILMYLMQRY